MPLNPDTDEHQAIVDAIIAECEAFYARDFDLWSTFWLQHEDTRRMGTHAGGHLEYMVGWADEAEKMQRMMRDYPNPNPSVPVPVWRENMKIRIFGDMAWASFDQLSPPTADIFVKVGLSYQIRVFEKQKGRWLVAFAGHGDTSMEYFKSPTIHVDEKAAILWRNDAARTNLPVHPILTESASFLRGRTSAQDRELREAITRAADLTVIDIRASVLEEKGSHSSIALVFDDPLSDIFHVVWVTRTDGQIVVSFGDDAALQSKLDDAQALYKMSKAQVRLARYIVEGRDMQQAADMIGISVSTARTHLQRMFDKTKVHSQTALVRVLLSAKAPTT